MSLRYTGTRRQAAQGCALITYLLAAIVFVILLLLFLFRLLGGQFPLDSMIGTWNRLLGDPVVYLLLASLALVEGNIFLGMMIFGLGYAAVNYGINYLYLMISRLATYAQTDTSANELHSRLRSVFAGDEEQVGFVLSKFGSGTKSAPAPVFVLFRSFAPLGAYTLVYVFNTLIALAVFHGILRVYAGWDTTENLLRVAGDLSPRIAEHLPVPPDFLGAPLREFSLTLFLAAMAVSVASLYTSNITPNGRLRPIFDSQIYIVLVFSIVVSIFTLNGALLLYFIAYFFGSMLLRYIVGRVNNWVRWNIIARIALARNTAVPPAANRS